MRPGRHDPSVFGHIPGFPIGKTWDSRQACSDDAVHPGIMKGIYGRREDGARSVALSGGYEDDEDNGDTFTYTGSGGRDLSSGRLGKKLRTGPQAYDQDFESSNDNAALLMSSKTGKPVRVVRGYKLDSIFAPAEGYRYDGLYRVIKAWREKGKAGYMVCRFKFRRLPDQPDIPRLSYHPDPNNSKRRSSLPKRRRLEAPISRRTDRSLHAGPSSRDSGDMESIRSSSPARKRSRSAARPPSSDVESVSDSEEETRAPKTPRRGPVNSLRLRTDKIRKGSVPIYRPPWAK